MIGQTRRLLETVRHLRPEQIYGRALHKLSWPAPDLSPAPPVRPVTGNWAEPAPKSRSMIGPNRFCFLNHTACIEQAEDWNSPAQDKLWLYNLHYFDDLNGDDAAGRHAWHWLLLDRWIAENPPASGNGWEPYPTSLRIVNWIKWALSGTGMTKSWQDSLAVQTRWLASRLERHLLGNHLMANAKALVFAGCYFSGDEAEGWGQKGLAILQEQIAEQVLGDGGHFERSAMYHALILEDVLDLINLAGAYPDARSGELAGQLGDVAPGMLSWLEAMCHPDGRISFFNDAAFAIAPDLEALRAYAERCDVELPSPSAARLLHLADSGYIRLDQGDCVALLDTAPVGPDYLPGHAHADTLSFEMSLFGQRLIVNGGTSVYGTGAERQRQRSTAAHSTVEIDVEPSSEVWAGFRVARRARPRDLSRSDENGVLTVSCAHDGYHRLAGTPTHRRTWRLHGTRLNIRDHIEGAYGHALAHFPFAPNCKVEFAPGGKEHVGTIEIGDEHILSWRSNAPASIVQTTWHPEFGLAVPNSALVLPVLNGELIFELNW